MINTITILLLFAITLSGIVTLVKNGLVQQVAKYWAKYFPANPPHRYAWIELNSCDMI